MSIYCGDMQSITCTHSGTTYRFKPKANESFNVDTGGIRNNDDANQKTTDGSMIIQKNTFRGMIEGPIAVEQETEKTLSMLCESALPQIWTFVSISGRTYTTNDGVIVGDIQSDSNVGTMTLKVACSKYRQLT